MLAWNLGGIKRKICPRREGRVWPYGTRSRSSEEQTWKLRCTKAGRPAGLPDSSQAHAVPSRAEHQERKQREPVGMRPCKERVVFFRPGIEELVHRFEEAS